MAEESDPATALAHLRRPQTQRHSEDTRQLLKAGLELLNEVALDAGPGSLKWPSIERVVGRYNRNTGLKVSRAIVDDRWKSADDFASDLFAWTLHRSQWSGHHTLAQEAVTILAGCGSISAAVQELALADLRILLGEPGYRLKLLICALSSADLSRAALESYYRYAIEWWSELYTVVLAFGGEALRPDVPTAVFATLMTAMEEGLALRLRAAPALFDDGIDTAASHLAVGAMGLFLGLGTKPGDTRPVTAVMDERFPTGEQFQSD